ncbi:MAG TPA: phenylalanine 4-monooxygenase [Bacteroidia bacterium]|jgi:phenylalanine-4-hydroxylase|nr:phenylalanine 4-monooxygenase [Bacteroidia bacterium]
MKNRPLKQVYSDYTAQDFAVWKILFDRQMKTLKPIVSQEYLKAIEQVKFTNDKIPDFKEVNAILQSITGWSLEVVPNISPQKEFFEFLSQKKFTSTCWLRSMEQLDYLEEPDMFHDVFAHVPLLCNENYVNFFKGISDIALKHINNPEIVELLGRIYWFTIEFGLIKENGQLKIYGAGIISSKGETEFCLSPAAKRSHFDVSTIFNTSFRTDQIQEEYFVIESFEELYNSLGEIEELIQVFLEKEVAQES